MGKVVKLNKHRQSSSRRKRQEKNPANGKAISQEELKQGELAKKLDEFREAFQKEVRSSPGPCPMCGRR